MTDWNEGVEMVDERGGLTRDQHDCPTCGEPMASTMAETETEGTGPAYACPGCGRVDRI